MTLRAWKRETDTEAVAVAGSQLFNSICNTQRTHDLNYVLIMTCQLFRTQIAFSFATIAGPAHM